MLENRHINNFSNSYQFKWLVFQSSELPTKSVKTELIRGVILQSQPPARSVTMLHTSHKVSEPA